MSILRLIVAAACLTRAFVGSSWALAGRARPAAEEQAEAVVPSGGAVYDNAYRSGPMVMVFGDDDRSPGRGKFATSIRAGPGSRETRAFAAPPPQPAGAGAVTLRAGAGAAEAKAVTLHDDEKPPPPSDSLAVQAAAVGMLIGAAIGFMLGGPIGACVGLLAGVFIGALAAKIWETATAPPEKPAAPK